MDVLHKCDAALQAQVQENALQKQIIQDQEDRFNAEHRELESATLWKPIAIGGGVIIGLETLLIILNHR